MNQINLFKLVALSTAITSIFILACTPQPTLPSVEPAPNQPPLILAINAPGEVLSGNSAFISCAASDPDNDELFFEWKSIYGSIKGEGSAIEWALPVQPGTYDITVVVSDNISGADTKTIYIEVYEKLLEPLELSVLVTKEDNTQLLFSPEDMRPILTRKWSVLKLECITQIEPGEKAEYLWHTEDGKIEGEGRFIRFVPMKEEYSTVQLTVNIPRRQPSNLEIRFYASCCGKQVPHDVRER